MFYNKKRNNVIPDAINFIDYFGPIDLNSYEMREIPEKLKQRYRWFKQHSASADNSGISIEIIAAEKKGLLSEITGTIYSCNGNISHMESWNEYDDTLHIHLKMENMAPEAIDKIKKIADIIKINATASNIKIWGKRIIIIGGGAQVSSVATGAILEADRHNIRGENISVDTNAVIGEEAIADAILAVGKLHRVGILVLAGSLMGGRITKSVKILRSEYGIPVLALKMAGSVTREADLVVTDPVEAGVMSVMLISNIAKFDLLRVEGRCY